MRENEPLAHSNISFLTKDYSDTLKDCYFKKVAKCNNKYTLICQIPRVPSTFEEYCKVVDIIDPPYKIRPYFIMMGDETYKITNFELVDEVYSTTGELSIIIFEKGERVID